MISGLGGGQHRFRKSLEEQAIEVSVRLSLHVQLSAQALGADDIPERLGSRSSLGAQAEDREGSGYHRHVLVQRQNAQLDVGQLGCVCQFRKLCAHNAAIADAPQETRFVHDDVDAVTSLMAAHHR
jgi:hypothetical protein